MNQKFRSLGSHPLENNGGFSAVCRPDRIQSNRIVEPKRKLNHDADKKELERNFGSYI